MHETNRKILAELPATTKQIAAKLNMSEAAINRRMRFLLFLKRITPLGKEERKFDEGRPATIYGELE